MADNSVLPTPQLLQQLLPLLRPRLQQLLLPMTLQHLMRQLRRRK